MTLPARLADTTQADIDRLVATSAQEGPHLDFKRDFPTRWDNETKVKVLADVIAFANAGGGDVIYGVDEDSEAKAAAVVPQLLANVDEEVRRLLDIVLNQTEPRVPGVQVQAVPVAVGNVIGHVVAVRVPQSWAGPHRNRINQHFHVREGLRNRPLDVPEVRALFLRTDSQAQRMRDFRTERLGKVISRELPCEVAAGPCLVLHVIPTQAALGLVQLDPVPYSRRQRTLPMLGTATANTLHLNLDGALGTFHVRDLKAGYAQQFRQGFFEAVLVLQPIGKDPRAALPDVYYERHVIGFVEQVRRELDAQGVATDVAVFISLLGASETVYVGRSDFGLGHASWGFDRRDVVLPDVLVPADTSVGRGLRPAFDLMAQAAGQDGSTNYTEQGEWTDRQAR